MNKIKNIYGRILIFALLCMPLAGCDMEVVPPSNIATETYWTTERDAWNSLNAIYNGIVPGCGIYDDAFSDDVYCQYSWESVGSLFQQDGLSAGHVDGTDFNEWVFVSIRRANTFLANVDKCNMDNDLRNRMKAEVRFLRAFDYLHKTLRFGKVPLMTEPLAYDAPNVPRNSVEEVRKFILDELDAVSKILPEKYTGGYTKEKGRATRYAALALKARAALYFGDYATAEAAAKEVMDKGGYSLFRLSALSDNQLKEAAEMDAFVDFAQLGIDKDKFIKGMFSYVSLWYDENANTDNLEYIMTRQYAPVSKYQDWVRYTAMRPNQIGGWSSVTPTQNLVDQYWTANGQEPTLPTVAQRAERYGKIKQALDAYGGFKKFTDDKKQFNNYEYLNEFRNRDSRMYVSIMIPFKGWYETNYGSDYTYEWKKGGNDESKTGFNFRKMVALAKDPSGEYYPEAIGDYPCIRYAEVLLTYAEARTQNAGFDAQVQSALNEIRDRCGMPNVPSSLSKEAGLALIQRERHVELAGEGFRSDDMTRYSDDYWTRHMNNVSITSPDAELVITMKWSQRMRLRPIPQTALDLNPLLKADQNTGY